MGWRMFAEAAGWQRPIRFAGGVGDHLNVPAVAGAARAADRGEWPAFGELASDGQVFRLTRR
jgi:hypothetical protein